MKTSSTTDCRESLSSKSESDIQSSILADLRSLGRHCECFKIQKTSDNGEPDIFFTTRITGAVLIEVKKPGGRISKLQISKLKKLNDCGTKAFACYSWQAWVEVKKSLGLYPSSFIGLD